MDKKISLIFIDTAKSNSDKYHPICFPLKESLVLSNSYWPHLSPKMTENYVRSLIQTSYNVNFGASIE